MGRAGEAAHLRSRAERDLHGHCWRHQGDRRERAQGPGAEARAGPAYQLGRRRPGAVLQSNEAPIRRVILCLESVLDCAEHFSFHLFGC